MDNQAERELREIALYMENPGLKKRLLGYDRDMAMDAMKRLDSMHRKILAGVQEELNQAREELLQKEEQIRGLLEAAADAEEEQEKAETERMRAEQERDALRRQLSESRERNELLEAETGLMRKLEAEHRERAELFARAMAEVREDRQAILEKAGEEASALIAGAEEEAAGIREEASREAKEQLEEMSRRILRQKEEQKCFLSEVEQQRQNASKIVREIIVRAERLKEGFGRLEDEMVRLPHAEEDEEDGGGGASPQTHTEKREGLQRIS